MPVKLPQAVNVGLDRLQLVEGDRQFDVFANCREFLRHAQLVDVVAQAFANFTLDVLGMCDDVVGVRVLVQPLRSGLRADTRYSRDIIRGVAHECEVVDDLFRIDVKFSLDAIAVENGFGHCIDERDMVVDELCHVLVTRRDEYVQPAFGAPYAQRSDHVVGLNALDTQ